MVRKIPLAQKTQKERRWRKGKKQVKCEYCEISFYQNHPSQKYCCASHRVMACRERKEKD